MINLKNKQTKQRIRKINLRSRVQYLHPIYILSWHKKESTSKGHSLYSFLLKNIKQKNMCLFQNRIITNALLCLYITIKHYILLHIRNKDATYTIQASYTNRRVIFLMSFSWLMFINPRNLACMHK